MISLKRYFDVGIKAQLATSQSNLIIPARHQVKNVHKALIRCANSRDSILGVVFEDI